MNRDQMENRITRQPLGITIVLFSLLLSFFLVRHAVAPQPVETAIPNLTPFGSLICGWLEGLPHVETLISVALILMTAVIMTRLVARNLLFSSRTNVFLILFAIAGYGIFIRSGNVPAVAAAFLIVRASENFTYAFKRSVHIYESFKAAMLLGLAPMLYAPAAVYVFMLPVAMSVYMRGWRETAVSFIGLLLPTTAYCYIMWAAGDPFTLYFRELFDSLMTAGKGMGTLLTDAGSVIGIARISLASLLVVAMAMSLGAYFLYARKMRTRAFRIYLYMVFFVLAGIGGMFLPCASIGDLPLLAFPFAMVSSKYFARHLGWAPNLIGILTIAIAITYNLLLLI